MGFDPIMMAMANPKVIDLSEYRSVGGTSIADEIEMLFMQGGGAAEFYSMGGSLWSEIDTKKPLRINIPLSFAFVQIDGVVAIRDADTKKPYMLCCSFMALVPDLANIKIIIVGEPNDGDTHKYTINVVVE